jgi:hypothetical protein
MALSMDYHQDLKLPADLPDERFLHLIQVVAAIHGARGARPGQAERGCMPRLLSDLSGGQRLARRS